MEISAVVHSDPNVLISDLTPCITNSLGLVPTEIFQEYSLSLSLSLREQAKHTSPGLSRAWHRRVGLIRGRRTRLFTAWPTATFQRETSSLCPVVSFHSRSTVAADKTDWLTRTTSTSDSPFSPFLFSLSLFSFFLLFHRGHSSRASPFRSIMPTAVVGKADNLPALCFVVVLFPLSRYLLLSRCSDSWKEWRDPPGRGDTEGVARWKETRAERRKKNEGGRGGNSRHSLCFVRGRKRSVAATRGGAALRRAGKWMSATSTTPGLHQEIPFIYLPPTPPPPFALALSALSSPPCFLSRAFALRSVPLRMEACFESVEFRSIETATAALPM